MMNHTANEKRSGGGMGRQDSDDTRRKSGDDMDRQSVPRDDSDQDQDDTETR